MSHCFSFRTYIDFKFQWESSLFLFYIWTVLFLNSGDFLKLLVSYRVYSNISSLWLFVCFCFFLECLVITYICERRILMRVVWCSWIFFLRQLTKFCVCENMRTKRLYCSFVEDRKAGYPFQCQKEKGPIAGALISPRQVIWFGRGALKTFAILGHLNFFPSHSCKPQVLTFCFPLIPPMNNGSCSAKLIWISVLHLLYLNCTNTIWKVLAFK